MAAQADLDEIWDYTADRWSAEQADRYIIAIGMPAGSSSKNPPLRTDRRGRPGYLKALIASHVLFFRITDAKQIDILGFSIGEWIIRSTLWTMMNPQPSCLNDVGRSNVPVFHNPLAASSRASIFRRTAAMYLKTILRVIHEFQSKMGRESAVEPFREYLPSSAGAADDIEQHRYKV